MENSINTTNSRGDTPAIMQKLGLKVRISELPHCSTGSQSTFQLYYFLTQEAPKSIETAIRKIINNSVVELKL